MLTLLADLASGVLLAAIVPGSLYLALITVAGTLPLRDRSGGMLPGRVAIVVPAHDEESVIVRTLDNLLRVARSDGASEVVVVADNCTDQTAAIARIAGARVLERNDPRRRGKGHALDDAFSRLLREDYVAFAVVDADSVVEESFVATLRRLFGAGELAVQARYTVLEASRSPRTRLAEIALAAFNVLRPRGRERLGLSAGILGNGFALRREVVERVPYTARSVVEDLEYHLKLVRAGIRVAFADTTTVRGEMPAGGRGAVSQRARWEGGRLRVLRENGPALARALFAGQRRLLEPLADLLLPPLAYHLIASLVVALLLGLLALAGGSPLPAGLALGALAIVVLHVLAALRVAGLPLSSLRALAGVPAYLVWKLRIVGTILAGARPGSDWTRTERSGS